MDDEKLKGTLEYIAASPPQEYGGFHPQTVEVAKECLKRLFGNEHQDQEPEV